MVESRFPADMYGGTWRRAQAAPKPDVPWRWAMAGAVVGTCLAVAIHAPARWLAGGLSLATGQQLQLAEPTGTVWRGSAQLVLTGGQGSHDRASLPGRLHWRLSPHWKGLLASVQADCCTPQPVVVGIMPVLSGLKINAGALQADLPAQLLEGLGAPWNTLQPQGRLSLSSSGMTFRWLGGRATLAGTARFTVTDMSSRVSTLKPLGSYQVEITGGDTPKVALSTLGDSPLRLSGSGQWVGARLRFSGVAEAAPEHEAQLSNLLTLMGRRSGSRSIITVG
jgi:general secretion pathway protein N